ncbi:hypothetical protein BDW02DRAFT_594806 [Decorospora gaudefroyi]|uniref:IBR domain-containing protein n=1 Tax=Decorospora gaudefroyi TaxID=184978 RepID=A0A6A5KMJ1_9PLEO|nr:hypothetical protein BDW02DRAFT_594806 [Decorospora gaudefroyi]
MAALGAKRCPKCQYVTIKDGGCSHMIYKRCSHAYDCRAAEKVQAPRPNVDQRKEAIKRALQEYDLHFQQVSAEASGDPCQDVLAYITYGPASEQDPLDYDADLDADPEELYGLHQACEMDATRGA